MLQFKTKRYDIEVLRKEMNKKHEELNKMKDACKIMIIDDDIEEESYLLKDSIDYMRDSLTMNIRTLKDLNSFHEAEPFNVIVCDCEGIGRSMKFSDGIDLITRLKELYGDKIYALMSKEKFHFAKLNIDKTIRTLDKREMAEFRKKGKHRYTLEHYVGKMVENFADPVYRWEILRAGMLKNHLSIHDVAKLESAYVKSIINKNKSIYDKAVLKMDTPSDNSEIVLSYIKTAASIVGTIISFL